MGLVQTALGSIVVLTTSTMNRVMVVELALPAMLPGALVALHYFIQMLRPRLGHGSDVGGRRTRWIVSGMAMLAIGGTTAAAATAWMSTNVVAGIALAIVAFLLIGIGVGAAGTSLLALVAKQVEAERRAAAATIMWVMMIAGFVVTAGVSGHFLDPFSTSRLVMVTAIVSVAAFCLASAAIWRLERYSSSDVGQAIQPKVTNSSKMDFRATLSVVWRDVQARRFTIFVFVSMLAYSAQDLILEPFAGIVFAMTPGQTTSLSALQNSGVLVGMILVALADKSARRWLSISLREWSVLGCVLSALALVSIAVAGYLADNSVLRASVLILGFGNGVFAVAAIGRMMDLAAEGTPGREGIRMGLWGAAQAIAFGLGGVLGAAGVDAARAMLLSPMLAYGLIFCAEALLFLISARLAYRIGLKRIERRNYVSPSLTQLAQD
jgi:BCD family chlorophyll transporter-like MFS transporter